MTIIINTNANVIDNQNAVIIDTFEINFIDPELKTLIQVTPYKIKFSAIDYGNLKIDELFEFPTIHRIIASSHIKPNGIDKDWLLVLTETNELFVLSSKLIATRIDLIIIQRFSFNDVLNSERETVNFETESIIPVAVNPILKTDPKQRFIAVGSCRGFLIILELKPSKKELFNSAQDNRTPLIIKKTPGMLKLNKFKIFEEPVTVWLGDNINIHDLVFFNSVGNHEIAENTWFALINRNLDLQYILSYYKISKIRNLKVELFKSMEQIDSQPNLMIPLEDSVLLVCDTEQILYPIPGTDLEINLSNNEYSDEIETEINNHENEFLTRNIYCPEGILENFVTFCKYNSNADENILIVSKNGDYYNLHLKILYERSNTVTVSERTRSENLINLQLKNKMIVKSWEIKKVHLSNELYPDYLFFDNNSSLFLSINRFTKIGFFGLHTLDKPEMLLIHENRPITCMKLLENGLTSDILFSQGNHERSILNSIELKNQLIKEFHVFNSDYLILLTESRINNFETNTIDILNKIEIYKNSSDSKYCSGYDFEPNATACQILMIPNIKPFFSNEDSLTEEEVYRLQDDLKNGFLVITSGVGDYDDKTEILLFTVDGLSGVLDLRTMAVVDSKSTFMNIYNDRKILVWGERCFIGLGVGIFRDTNNEVNYKLMKIDEKINLPFDNVSCLKKIGNYDYLVLDPFLGLFWIKFNKHSDKFNNISKAFEYNTIITVFDILCLDLIVFGDLLGNIFFVKLDHQKLKCSIHGKFNLISGSIGCIESYRSSRGEDITLNDMNESCSIRKLFTVGTNEGCIIDIYFSKDDNAAVKKMVKFQSKSGMEKVVTVDRNTYQKKKSDIKENNNDVDVMDFYYQNTGFLEQRFIKVTDILNHKVDVGTNDLCILDLRFIDNDNISKTKLLTELTTL